MYIFVFITNGVKQKGLVCTKNGAIDIYAKE